MMSDPLRPIERTSVPEEIARRLTSFILDAGLRPGDRMPSERQLMERLRVGRSSLREAIRTLAAVGIVRVAGGDGMFVGDGEGVLTRPLSWGLLIGEHATREVVEARRVVEVELAGRAAERATPEEVAALETRLRAMEAALGDPPRFTDADAEFHVLVASAARNRVLSHVLETLRHVVRAWIYRTFTEAGERGRSYEEHVRVFEAIRAGDAAAARVAMAAHMDGATERLQTVLERNLEGP